MEDKKLWELTVTTRVGADLFINAVTATSLLRGKEQFVIAPTGWGGEANRPQTAAAEGKS
jgi:hypothetical protein